MMAIPPEYTSLVTQLKRISAINSVNDLIQWDEEVMMPPGEGWLRGEQKAALSGVAHDLFVSETIGNMLDSLKGVRLAQDQRRVVDVTRRNYERERKVPTLLVEEKAQAETAGYAAWVEARKHSDFALFVPHLERLVDISRRRAAHIDPAASAYAVLFHDYEPDISLPHAKRVIGEIRDSITPIVLRINGLEQPNTSFLSRKIPVETQERFHRQLAKDIGFNFRKGRLDTAPHPFTSGGRMTTRYSDTWDTNIGSTMHEAGHAMYEQNLDKRHFGTPIGASASLSVHESQSRLWELNVGMYRPFWNHQFPKLKAAYAPTLDDVSLDEFMLAIHKVEPSFIRITADEVTYPLHIALRMEVEEGLIEGSITPDAVPRVWNEKMRSYFGITPPVDAKGCLQDVHWSQSLFGYFPTYVLGTAIASQLYVAAEREMPMMESEMSRGNTGSLRRWLKRNIHSQGQRYPTDALVTRATGHEFTPKDYLDRIARKCATVYWPSG